MPGARPKIQISDLPYGWAVKTLELYKEGASDVEIRANVFDGMSQDLWERLIAEEEEFSITIKKGRTLSQGWWMKTGREGTKYNKDSYTEISTSMWFINMKNRFGWADKQQVDNKHSGEVTVKSFFD
mgnify:CR=1 FL=1